MDDQDFSEFTFTPLQVGSPAPHFRCEAYMPEGNFEHVALEDYKGKWVVLFFPLPHTDY